MKKVILKALEDAQTTEEQFEDLEDLAAFIAVRVWGRLEDVIMNEIDIGKVYRGEV